MANKFGAALIGTKDGLSRTKEYRAWSGMIHRCYHKSYSLFHRYGGRGITVCDRWMGDDGFSNFMKDMGLAPSDKHSLDRERNDGNYEPDNCRWATIEEQNRNRRTNVYYTWGEETKTLKDWCISLGIKYSTIWRRINGCGWSFERAITTPIVGDGRFKKGHKPYTHDTISSHSNGTLER